MTNETEPSAALPQHVRVVVIGGGVVGCSVLYHLAARGVEDAILLEKNDLTNGATWHAAGLVGQLRSSRNATRLTSYSAELYRNLEQITGQSAGWNEVGSLRLASSEDRLLELRKIATQAGSFGIEIELLSPEACQEKFPIMQLAGCVGGVYCATDGYADPSMLTQALARGARQRGARIFRNTRVTGFEKQAGLISTVFTDQGDVQCDVVVNCAGMWARRIGKMAGVNVPIAVMEHQYVVTKEIEGVPRDLPVTRDPDKHVYYRSEVGGLIFGGFEPRPILHNVGEMPWDFVAQLFEPNYDQFEQLFVPGLELTPCLEQAEVRQLVNGPDAYTTDSHFLLGPTPEVSNFYLATGMNCFGIAGAGGVGKAISEWILDGRPEHDLYSEDIRRFNGPHYAADTYIGERTREHYPKHYTLAWPHEQDEKERPLRRSPLYQILKARRACFGEKSGWERALWFAPEDVEPVERMHWGRPHWHEHVAREVKAIRENVALLDQTSFGKLEVQGADAVRVLQRLCTRNIDRPDGSLSYSQMCNQQGGIECDLTVLRLANDHFYLVTGTSFARHDLNWIESHIEPGEDCVARDVTSSRGVLNLCGPNSPAVLQKATSENVSNEQFPFGTGRLIYVGSAPVLALRISYHGELGWELHIPVEYTAYVYEKLMGVGAELGIRDVGYRALESCRLDKGYFVWSADLNADYDPYSAGLGFNVHLKKGDFIGRAALAEIKQNGPRLKMSFFVLDEETEIYGSEPLYCDGTIREIVTSGGFSHTLGKPVALAYVPVDCGEVTRFEVESFGRRIGATRHMTCLYDPKGRRLRG